MAILAYSQMSLGVAAQRVAEAAGSSGSADQLEKASHAVRAALEHWNNFHNWNYLLQPDYQITTVEPFSVTCTLDTSTTHITSSITTGLQDVLVGDLVEGDGIPLGTTVAGLVDTDEVYLSATPTAAGTVSVTFYRRDYALPSDLKTIYTVRNLSTSTTMASIMVRDYNRMIPTEDTGSPTHYSAFTTQSGGTLRLVPTPSVSEVIAMNYYRRMTVPSNTTDLLDVPQDYEYYVVALAKAFYLIDKGGEVERQNFWWGYAQRGMIQARAQDLRHPDEDTGFMPAVPAYPPTNPNTIEFYLGGG